MVRDFPGIWRRLASASTLRPPDGHLARHPFCGTLLWPSRVSRDREADNRGALMPRTGLFVLACLLGSVGIATAQPAHQRTDSPTVPVLKDVRPEILQLVVDDQWDRGNDMFGGRQVKAPSDLDWQAIAQRDQERQSKIRALLKDGHVQTGKEFHYAALIFQHSSTTDELALAHVLAVTAVIQGDETAKWLAAATFDRYRQNEKERQVFGTQFMLGPGDSKWSMDPYDEGAVPDSVRTLWCVVSLAEQKGALERLQSGKDGGANTSIRECH